MPQSTLEEARRILADVEAEAKDDETADADQDYFEARAQARRNLANVRVWVFIKLPFALLVGFIVFNFIRKIGLIG